MVVCCARRGRATGEDGTNPKGNGWPWNGEFVANSGKCLANCVVRDSQTVTDIDKKGACGQVVAAPTTPTECESSGRQSGGELRAAAQPDPPTRGGATFTVTGTGGRDAHDSWFGHRSRTSKHVRGSATIDADPPYMRTRSATMARASTLPPWSRSRASSSRVKRSNTRSDQASALRIHRRIPEAAKIGRKAPVRFLPLMGAALPVRSAPANTAARPRRGGRPPCAVSHAARRRKPCRVRLAARLFETQRCNRAEGAINAKRA